MSYIIYAFAVVINLLGTILTFPLAFVLAVCYSQQEGWCLNGTTWQSGPRLWSWLSWFQTPNNSLNGDQTYISLHSPCWWSKVRWLQRNPFYGFDVKYFDGSSGMTYQGNINCNATTEGTIRVQGHGLWQYNSYHKLFGKMLELNFGHNIRALVDPGFVTPDQWHNNSALIKNYPATFAFTVRFV
jgi:hypothetical protein